MSEAGVYIARGVHELHQMVSNLAREGFRIVTVIDPQTGDYHIVAQKESQLVYLPPTRHTSDDAF